MPDTGRVSAAAAGLLASCPPGEWYFAGRRNGEPYSAWTRGKAELDTMLNIEHWVLHDLRKTGVTLMERAGVLRHVIEATLNHTIPGVAGVYRDTTSWRRRRPHWKPSPPSSPRSWREAPQHRAGRPDGCSSGPPGEGSNTLKSGGPDHQRGDDTSMAGRSLPRCYWSWPMSEEPQSPPRHGAPLTTNVKVTRQWTFEV
jgi:hypothetical protein